MNWAAFSSVFFVATFKFLFSPFAGIPLGLDFLTTYIAAVSGATLSSLLFYFGSELLMEISRKNKLKKENDAVKSGTPLKPKKKFTRGNKMTIKLKRSFGKIGLCFLAPSLLSIPVGTIIVAKFYGKDKDTFLWVFIGLLLSGLITTSLAYFVFSR
jgi:hypothetical protein